MASPYREIFAAPGAWKFSAAGLLGRMPLSMTGIGVVTMVSQLTGRYRLAGALSATMAMSVALLGPQVSRLVDRYGQRRTLRPAALLSAVALAGLLACAARGAPDWTLFLFAACTGCVPSVGAMVRARWAALHRGGDRRLHAAYSWESMVDEVCFIVGPILSIGLSTSWFPEAGPLVAGVFLLAGVAWLCAQRPTEPAAHPPAGHGGRSALRSTGLQVLVATFVATGAVFGAVDVVTVAYADELGHKGSASLVLAAYALGSCLAGALFGLVRLSGPVARRWLVGVLAMAVSMIPLQLAGSLPLLAVALFVAGLAVAPTMVSTMGLVEAHVPRSALTEGMTWTSTGLSVGVALGSSAAGWVVDAAGARAGYAVPGAAGAAAAVVALLGHRRLSRPATVSRRKGREADGVPQHLGEQREQAGGTGSGGECQDGQEAAAPVA
ncbi:MFS transporter [Streptomyces tremellae]|uniref:MFS transporter n=1 Tax=Streptomyces tremellae TaxID=1124239 RepID=A0ABP7DNY7_9ACTN